MIVTVSWIKQLRHVLREFSQEATGFVFWAGLLIGLLVGLSVSTTILLYSNFQVMSESTYLVEE